MRRKGRLLAGFSTGGADLADNERVLTARAYTLRQKSRLAISLSWIAGYTNVATLIVCGVMTSHATGNITHFAMHLAEVGDTPRELIVSAGFCVYLVVCFVVGAIFSGIMLQTAGRHHVRSVYVLPVALQAMFLLIVSIGVSTHVGAPIGTTWIYVITGVACCAMGLQNATITQVSGSVVRTTHLTGVLTDFGTDLVAVIIWLRDKTRGRGPVRWRRAVRALRRHTQATRVLLLISIAGSFTIGVLFGTVMIRHWPHVGLLPPVAFLLWIVWMDYYQPIADLKELDPVSDPELEQHGIDRSMLPHDLALFRLTPRLSGTEHHAPSFTSFADDLPRHVRVVILSLHARVHFDGDAALDLQAAARRLREAHRHLLLAGVRAEHYDVLDRYGVTQTIDVEDLCSDLEFAVARGIHLLHDLRAPAT